MSEKLKPCPFCGSRNVAHGLFGGDMIVKCISCFSGGPPVDAPEFSDMVEKRDEAVAAWNRRADDPQSMTSEALAAHIAELQLVLNEKRETESL
jgi:Lar family restriction alleviation protein